MKAFVKVGGFFLVAVITFLPLVTAGGTPEDQESKAKAQGASKTMTEVARGRYLVMISGCNDCHTHGYLQLEGKVPEADWLTGESIGWYGPWGTTYPINLRLFMQNLSEDAWIKFSRAARSRPSMPWWVLHEMKEQDLRAILLYVNHLGPKGVNAAAYLPPNQKPQPPYFEFVPKVEK